MENEKKQQFNEELTCLIRGFCALKIDYKKGVLETAQELLKIQRTYKEMVADGAGFPILSVKSRNEQ